jgi:energy-coupling factor transport system substrate-specific component
MSALVQRIPFGLVNLLGALAFAFPFISGAFANTSEGAARGADAPWLLALLVPLILAVAMAESTRGRLDSKGIALLGVLAALAALMRVPLSIGGANLMFFLPLVGGFVFGPSFGFLLGAFAMLASGVITGGIGPWLPFQVLASGWIGAGAGLLRPLGDRLHTRPIIQVAVLATFGYLAGLFYGVVINLYFWPLLPVRSEIGWTPGLGLRETLEHYRSFYLLTSLAWDALRGVANAVLILAVGVPVIELLRRYRRRFSVVQ